MLRVFLVIILMFSVYGCYSSANLSSLESDWLKANASESEDLLCSGSEGYVYYFVSMYENLVKVGLFLDVDHGFGRPLAFDSATKIEDGRGKSIMSPTYPEVHKESYVKIDGKYFVEIIEAYEILYNKTELEGIFVQIDIEFVGAPNGENGKDKNILPNGVIIECYAGLSS